MPSHGIISAERDGKPRQSFAQTYRKAEKQANGPCPIESGVIGRLADHECKHGRLPGDKNGEPCDCWPPPPTPPNAFKRRRLMLGYTQARLAAEAGVSVTTIVRIEAGERAIWSSMSRLAFALKCDAEWLFPNEPRIANPSEYFNTPSKTPDVKARAFDMHRMGLSSAQIARQLRVPQPTVARWMRGS